MATSGSPHHFKLKAERKYILHFSDNHLNYTRLPEPNSPEAGEKRYRKTGDNDDSKSTEHYSLRNHHEMVDIVYGKDSPIELINTALIYAKTIFKERPPDIFLFTGDSSSHDPPLKPKEGEKKAAENWTPIVKVVERVTINIDIMYKEFPDVMSISTLFGNTDTSPGYACKIPNEEGGEIEQIKEIAGAWKKKLSKGHLDQFKKKGYDIYKVDDNFVVITLNTAVWSYHHKETKFGTIGDPLGQFEWLRKQLEMIRNKNKINVLICGHIPPAVGTHGAEVQWLAPFMKEYLSIIREYKNIIKAQLFGHLHVSEVRISMDEDLPPLFITTAISPKYFNNPAFIVWEYDPRTYELTDFFLHGSDINDKKVKFEPLFQATESYHLKDLSLRSLRNMVTQMEKDQDLVKNYYWNSKARAPQFKDYCISMKCRAQVICGTQWFITKEEYEECLGRNGYQKPAPSKQSMRLLLPSTQTKNNQNSEYSILWALTSVLLAVILLGMTSFGLRRFFGTKAPSTRFAKGKKMGKM